MQTPGGYEPSLSSQHSLASGGSEPMLGGGRRARLDRDLFWALLDLHNIERRHAAIKKVIEQGGGDYYGARLAAVLSPGARYYESIRFWKIPYDYDHKLAAMDSLVRCNPQHALAGLVIALGNNDLGMQRAAISLIGRLPEEQAEEVLASILVDPRSELRHAAIQALGHRWEQPQILRLVNTHATVVCEAARWLGEHGEPRMMVPLIAAARDRWQGVTHETVQVTLLRAISRIAQRASGAWRDLATSALCRVLDNRETTPLTAQEAVVALYEIGTEDARAAAIVYHTSRLSGRQLAG